MKRKKILTVIGARPQIIKAFPVSRQLKINSLQEIIVHTGQHYDYEMSEVFFEEIGLYRSHYNLKVGSGTQAEQTAKMMIKLEKVLEKERPDLVLVYGDTNSTLAGGLTAAKLNLPVAHVEAGLRSFDFTMPEEINRVLTDRLSTLLFAPTQEAVKNLKKEGIEKGVFLTGDVMFDASLYFSKIASKKSLILKRLGLKPGSYYLLTIHRPANTDNPKNLSSILKALASAPKPVVFPVHPRTKKYLKKWGLFSIIKKSQIKVIPPLSYLDFLALEKGAEKILTDSGGVQKEAYFLAIPCLTLRENTEWTETIKAGWNMLVGADEEKITEALLNFNPQVKTLEPARKLFGRGNAAKKIAAILYKFLKEL